MAVKEARTAMETRSMLTTTFSVMGRTDVFFMIQSWENVEITKHQ
jgi:hypothetical protein